MTAQKIKWQKPMIIHILTAEMLKDWRWKNWRQIPQNIVNHGIDNLYRAWKSQYVINYYRKGKEDATIK